MSRSVVNDPSTPVVDLMVQPDDVTCGPTCLAMVGRALGRGRFDLDVHNLASMCGTNKTVGTTHEGVATALAGLGIGAARTLGREAAEAALRGAGRGDVVLCRTLTRGSKHWVLAVPADDGGFEVLDPWLGRRRADLGHVLALVAPRGFETWAIDGTQRPPHVTVGPLVTDGDVSGAVDAALAVCWPAFGRFAPGLNGQLRRTVHWDLSRAVRVDGEVVGVYLLNEDSVTRERFPDGAGRTLRDGRAVEGVALATLERVRGRGYGRLLRDEPARLGFDRVWGKAMFELGNETLWARHRRVVERTRTHVVTAADLAGPVYPELLTDGLDRIVASRTER